MELTPGACVLGHYVIDQVTEQSTNVWACSAHHDDKGYPVEVRAVGPLGNAAARTRCERALESFRRVKHPNLQGIEAWGMMGDRVLIASRHSAGIPLNKDLNNAVPMPASKAIGMVLSLLAGLEAIEQAGLVHGNLHPTNVIIATPTEIPTLGAPGVTQLLGSPLPWSERPWHAFMAPEHLRGEPGDSRSDLYACGLLLYTLLGTRVIGAQAQSPDELLELQRVSTHQMLGDLDTERGIQAILRRTLAWRAEERPSSAKALAHELRGMRRDLALKGQPHEAIGAALSTGSDEDHWTLPNLDASQIRNSARPTRTPRHFVSRGDTLAASSDAIRPRCLLLARFERHDGLDSYAQWWLKQQLGPAGRARLLDERHWLAELSASSDLLAEKIAIALEEALGRHFQDQVTMRWAVMSEKDVLDSQAMTLPLAINELLETYRTAAKPPPLNRGLKGN